jgi:type III pantothenate kinase
MILALDIGNTRIKVGIFDQDRTLIEKFVFKSLSSLRAKNLIHKYRVTHAITCNSGQLGVELMDVLGMLNVSILLSDQTPLPFTIDYKTPHTLGRDRIAAAAGANLFSADKPCLIINMGTCITMDVIAGGHFLGGNISPGISMRLKAMHKFTARLPLVQLALPIEDLGSDTESALQNGGIKGALWEVETFINEMNHKYNELIVFLAGGDANMFAKFTKNAIFVRPNIVLEGLIEILKYNEEK